MNADAWLAVDWSRLVNLELLGILAVAVNRASLSRVAEPKILLSLCVWQLKDYLMLMSEWMKRLGLFRLRRSSAPEDRSVLFHVSSVGLLVS